MTRSLQLGIDHLRDYSETSAGRQRLLVLSSLAIYPVLLLLAYRNQVAPAYAFMGYEYLPPDSVWPVLAAVVVATLPVPFMPRRVRRPGVVMIWMIYALVYVPSQVIPVVSVELSLVELLRLQASLVAGLGLLLAADRLPLIRLPRPPIPSNVYWAGFWCAYAGFTAILIWYIGFPTTLPTFGEVYDVRYEFIDRVAALPTPIAYIYSWLGQVLNPFLFACGVARRSWAMIGVGALGQVYLYGLSGEKSLVFAIALTVGIYAVLILARTRFVPIIALGTCALIVGSVALDALLGTRWFLALFIHRLTVTPGFLTGAYYEFFSNHPPAMLGYSVLAPIVDYHYDTSIPYVIGREVFGNPDTVANANIWADGYANFGFTGIVFASLIAGAVLWLFNTLSQGGNLLLGIFLAASAAFTWSNISIFTSMLTHGIALTLLLLWALPVRRPAMILRSMRAL